jgi:hypothetical protein
MTIAPVERALRALHHFDLGDVDQLLLQRVGARRDDAVDDDRDRQGQAEIALNTAHRDVGLAGADRLGQVDVGGQVDEVGRAGDVRALDRQAGEGLDRDRHVADVRFSPGRGDDDVAAGRLFGRGLGLCGRRVQTCQRGADEEYRPFLAAR